MKKKKRFFLLIGGFVGALAIAMFIVIFVANKSVVLFTVNGMTVTQEEMNLYAEQNRANVVGDYGAMDDKYQDDFENIVSEDGTTLLDILKEKCVDELIEVKVIHQLAKEYDLDYVADYENFQKRLNIENERRRKAIESGEVLYGPDIYATWDYYDYSNDTTRIALENYLRSTWNESDDTYHSYYEEHQADYARNKGVELQIYKWTYQSEQEKSAAIKNGEQYIARVQRGEAFDKLDDSVLVQMLGSDTTQRSDLLQFPTLLNAVKKAKAGDVIGPIVEVDAVYIAYCLKENSVEIPPYSEAEALVKNAVWNEYFRTFLEKQVSQAVVKYTTAYERWNIAEEKSK